MQSKAILFYFLSSLCVKKIYALSSRRVNTMLRHKFSTDVSWKKSYSEFGVQNAVPSLKCIFLMTEQTIYTNSPNLMNGFKSAMSPKIRNYLRRIQCQQLHQRYRCIGINNRYGRMD
eukprot:c7167_g1_i1 orf=3-353(+)